MPISDLIIPASYFQPHPSGKFRCILCPQGCLIAEGRGGICGTRRVKDGVLEAVNYGLVVSAAVDPIEKKPLYHFNPGSRVLSFGGLGCNMGCLHCQNASISCPKITELGHSADRYGEFWSPEAVVNACVNQQAAGIAFTYNEPTIWHEWSLDVSRLAKKMGLYTVYVTNAYIEQQPLDEIAPYLDAYAADLKGWGEKFHLKFSKAQRWTKILDAIDSAQNRHGLHVEVTTNIVPGRNDDNVTLRSISGWIYSNLGPLTVWHVSRFIPHHKLLDLDPTPVATLTRAWDIGHEAGLKHVFLGNVHGMKGMDDTLCPECGKTVISRSGYIIDDGKLDGSKCSVCKSEVGITLTGS